MGVLVPPNHVAFCAEGRANSEDLTSICAILSFSFWRKMKTKTGMTRAMVECGLSPAAKARSAGCFLALTGLSSFQRLLF